MLDTAYGLGKNHKNAQLREQYKTQGELNMKIDTSSIEGFDAMSAEEKLNAIMGMDIELPKDDKGEKERDDLKKLLSSRNSEIAELKKSAKEKLSQDERTKLENEELMAQMKADLDEYKRKETKANYTAKLAELGYKGELLESASEKLSEGDINSFFGIHAAYLSERDKEAKASAIAGMPELAKGEPPKGKTEDKQYENLRKYAGLTN